MKGAALRIIVPLAVLAFFGICFAARIDMGSPSAFGWRDIAVLCPVGALVTMLASWTVTPRAVVSLVIAAVVFIVFGRAFCGWACPVPTVSRLRDAFGRRSRRAASSPSDAPPSVEQAVSAADPSLPGKIAPLPPVRAERRGPAGSRHFVLGAALLSAAVFGFPVFCLICPVGLSFATVFLLIRAFGFGDVTWALVIVPALLVLEVTVFRKWCSHICPIGALASLVSKANRTFRPDIDDSKCLETGYGTACDRCGRACPEGINPRYPERGNAMGDCTKCRACIEACPVAAMTMPFIARGEAGKDERVLEEVGNARERVRGYDADSHTPGGGRDIGDAT